MLVSLKKVTLATVLTTILTAIMLALTANGVLAVALFPLSMLLFLFLFGVTGQINLWVKIAKVVAVFVTIIALILCVRFFKVESKEPEDESKSIVQTESTEETPNDEEENTEEMTGCNCNCGCAGCTCAGNSDVDSNAGTVSYTSTKKSTGGSKSNPFGDDMNASYSGGSSNDKTTPTGNSKVEGSDTTNFTTGSTELSEDQRKQIEQDKADGKNVIEHPSGVITTSDDKTKEEDTTPQNPNLDTSNTEQASTEPEEPNEDSKNEGPKELTDDELKNYGTSTDNSQDKEDDESNNSTPEDKDEEIKLTPVSIKADSDQAYAGDTVQFFITGDVESVEGYNGVSVASIINGVISIDTPDESQTITITVIGKDGSTASASVNVKKIGEIVNDDSNNGESTTPTEPEKPAVDNDSNQAPTEPVTDENNNNQSTTDNGNVDSNESESKPSTTPVSIVAIGGNTAIAGDSVQFRISGDVASIEGTSGFQTSQSNGVLNVQTQEGVATVIDITVNGVDGSQATATVTVNCPFTNNV